MSSYMERPDLSVSTLLAFGKAATGETNRRTSWLVDVAAWAMGPNGEDLGMGLVSEKRMREEGEEGWEVLVPSIITQDTPVWKFGTPVKQIRFASWEETGRRGFLLALKQFGEVIC